MYIRAWPLAGQVGGRKSAGRSTSTSWLLGADSRCLHLLFQEAGNGTHHRGEQRPHTHRYVKRMTQPRRSATLGSQCRVPDRGGSSIISSAHPSPRATAATFEGPCVLLVDEVFFFFGLGNCIPSSRASILLLRLAERGTRPRGSLNPGRDNRQGSATRQGRAMRGDRGRLITSYPCLGAIQERLD